MKKGNAYWNHRSRWSYLAELVLAKNYEVHGGGRKRAIIDGQGGCLSMLPHGFFDQRR